MIIIEGPDGVGKTTVAKRIAERLDLDRVRHMTKPDLDFDYHDWFLKSIDPHVIQDRYHLGGLVYGFLCGLHPTKIKKWKYRTLLQTLRRKGCFTIIMYQGSDTTYAGRIRTLEAGREEMFRSDQSIAVNATYRALVRQGRWIDTPICDIAYDIDKGFPTDATISLWMSAYGARRLSLKAEAQQ